MIFSNSKRKYSFVFFIGTAILAPIIVYNNCSKASFSYLGSQVEKETLFSNPFGETPPGEQPPNGPAGEIPPNDPLIPFDPNKTDELTGIHDEYDSLIPLNPFSAETKSEVQFIYRCNPANYEKEREAAIKAAKEDPLNKTIPVRYSISTGNVFDKTAFYAHRRSILRKGDSGKSKVYIGPKSSIKYKASHGAKHYIVDHSLARQQYIKGQKCFFSTVQIDALVNGPVLLDGKYDHTWAILHYGDKYGKNNQRKANLAPRLFDQIDHYAQPRIIPLYVVDIRDHYAQWTDESDFNLVQDSFSSSAIRRHEYQVLLKKLFDLVGMSKFRHQLTQSLSTPITNLDRWSFEGYDGVPQLIDNILFGYKGTVLSMQYTPLVLDLGRKNIQTSSVHWGTFFNMAGLKQLRVPTNSYKSERVTHQTAWLGGALVNQGNSDSGPHWQREADDGFLVVPKDGNKVISAAQMMGEDIVIDGERFTNGFFAIQKLSNKNCDSGLIKDRYLGSWDGEIYDEILKIWIDKNRNGHVDEELNELVSLKEAHVVAINTCSIVHQETEDRFHNRTHLRSAFLLDHSESPAESNILSQLDSGYKSDGSKAEFRVMVDIFFKTHPLHFLENIEVTDIDLPSTFPRPGDQR